MEIKVIDTLDGVTVYTNVEGCLSSVMTMPMEMYGLKGYYINRLVVSQKVRNRGIATALMKKLTGIMDNKVMDLILEVNAYGDLDHDKLVQFYQSFGFVASEKHKGLYVRKPKKRIRGD